MASGRSNKLVGQVGEFLVCAELGREHGLIATPFSGNVPGFDVIATNERGVSVPIEVKTNNGGNAWQLGAEKYLDIRFDPVTNGQKIHGRKRLEDPNTIYVFVWLSRDRALRDRFFVLTRREFQRVVHRHYAANLRAHGGKRPKVPDTRHTAISVAEFEKFENNWKLITKQLRLRRTRAR